MIFVYPERLWLLAASALVALWAIRGRIRRRRAWAALAQRAGAARWDFVVADRVGVADPRDGAAEVGAAGVARAPGHDAILLIDVSRSMGAEDAVPDRLSVAIEAAEKLVAALMPDPANRAAVVAFAGRGVLRCPLTENLGAVIDTLKRLRPGAVRPGGTDLGAGLDAAIEALGTDGHAQGQAIVVFSDGEDLADHWRSRLDRLQEREVVVHAVTIGDADHGHPVPSGVGGKPLVYRGEPVLSRRSDAALEAVAQETGGVVVRLGLTSADLGTLYRTRIEPAARRHREISRISDLTDRFPLFLAAAMTCLIAGCWPPGRGRSWRGAWSWRGGWSWRRSAKVLGRASLAIAFAAAVAGASRPPGGLRGIVVGWWQPASDLTGGTPRTAGDAGRPASASELVSRGQAAYAAGQLDEALSAFQAAVRLVPDAAVPRYDAAAVLFRLGQFDAARQAYSEARGLADSALRTKIDFALGNTSLALGDIGAAIAAYDDCIGSKARGARLDDVRKDAAVNREFAIAAQSPAMPQGEGSDDPSSSRRPDRKKSPDRRDGGDDPSSDGEPETGPSGDGTNPEDDADKAGRDRPPRKRRRSGGAGGARSTPPGATGESPEDRLDAALENIRAAQGRRLPEEQPPAGAGDDGRDW